MTGQFEIAFQEPNARNTDPETSHEAAADATFRASKNRLLALRLLYEHGPLTDYELSSLTGLQQNSIGKRRGECKAAGLVEALVILEKKVKRPAPSGSMALVWTLTMKGEAYISTRVHAGE